VLKPGYNWKYFYTNMDCGLIRVKSRGFPAKQPALTGI